MNQKTQTVKEAMTDQELSGILDLRYEILRKPWDQPYESSGDELENSSVNAYIGDPFNEIIACGRLQVNADGGGQVRYMAVRPSSRGKGLGSIVLSYLEEKALQKNLPHILLQARENAVNFYASRGYEVVEKSFLLWGKIQHYLMRKYL